MGLQRAVLLGGRQATVQGQDRGVDAATEALADAADGGGAGQKAQQVAVRALAAVHLAQAPPDRGREVVLDAGVGGDRRVLDVHGMHAAVAAHDRRARQERGDRLGGQGRRHHDDAQVGAGVALHLGEQGQRQVGVQRALVELVEDHAAHAVEEGVGL